MSDQERSEKDQIKIHDDEDDDAEEEKDQVPALLEVPNKKAIKDEDGNDYVGVNRFMSKED